MLRSVVLVLLIVVTAAGCTSGHAPGPAKPPAKISGPAAASGVTRNCPASIAPRPLPTWARAGFQPPISPMPYVIGDHGDIVAILWVEHDPLHAPPLADRSNKILWVSRTVVPLPAPLRIRANARQHGPDRDTRSRGRPRAVDHRPPNSRLLVTRPDLVRSRRPPAPAVRRQLSR